MFLHVKQKPAVDRAGSQRTLEETLHGQKYVDSECLMSLLEHIRIFNHRCKKTNDNTLKSCFLASCFPFVNILVLNKKKFLEIQVDFCKTKLSPRYENKEFSVCEMFYSLGLLWIIIVTSQVCQMHCSTTWTLICRRNIYLIWLLWKCVMKSFNIQLSS